MPESAEVIAARKKELELRQKGKDLNKIVWSAPPIQAPTVPQNSIQKVLTTQSSTVKYSDSGSGGAILVMPGPDLPVGAAIKVEGEKNIKKAEMTGKLMENFFKDATGPQPFAAPRIQVFRKEQFNQIPGLQASLEGTVDSLQGHDNVQKRSGFDATKKAIGDVAAGKTGVLMMEFAEGVQINKMPTADKEMLVRSDGFAQTLGRAMAPSMVLGLSDHLGGGLNGVSNVSNLMYSTKTGTLSVIDYDSDIEPVDQQVPDGAFRVQRPSGPKQLGEMRTFLEKAGESPEAFEKAVDDMVKGEKTPFRSLMFAVNNHGPDSLFGVNKSSTLVKPKIEDVAANKEITMEERRRFAANILIGAVDGMEYVQKNQQVLENAVNKTHEVDEHGNLLEHFYTQEEMRTLRQELAQLDAPSIKTNLGIQAKMWEMDKLQKLQEDVVAKTTNVKLAREKLQDMEKKVERLHDHPSAMDRLKTAFRSSDNSPLNKALQQRDQLQKDVETAQDERAMAFAKAQHFEKTQMQEKPDHIPVQNIAPTGNQLPGTRVDGGNLAQQQQVATHKPSVGEMLHMDHHHHTHQTVDSLGQSQDGQAPRIRVDTTTETEDQHAPKTKVDSLSDKVGNDSPEVEMEEPRQGMGQGQLAPKTKLPHKPTVGEMNPEFAEHLAQSHAHAHSEGHSEGVHR